MKLKKCYGLFRENLQTKKIEGLIENSFAMSWSPKDVRVWWAAKDVEYYLNKYLSGDKRFTDENEKDKFKYFIVRLSSPNSNFKILSFKNKKTKNYDRRNKEFSLTKQK